MKSKIALAILVILAAGVVGRLLVTSKTNQDSLKFDEGYNDGCTDSKHKVHKKTFYVQPEGPYVLGYGRGYDNCLAFRRP